MRWVVPPDREPVIAAMLHLDGRSGWALIDWAARARWIDARYRSRLGKLAIVRLLPIERRPPMAHRRTERFTIALLEGEGESLLDALAERLAVHEHAFAWQRAGDRSGGPARSRGSNPRELDVERIAFRRGLKPALRLRIAELDALWEAALQVREGAAVVALVRVLPYPGRPTILMVARSHADALALREAELDEFSSSSERARAGARALGLGLGYPPCCVDAFLATFDSGIKWSDDVAKETRTDLEGRFGNWRRSERAWVARPLPRLNNMLFGERLRVISFDPCRFDCPAAAALADAYFRLLVAEAPEAATTLERELARPVAIDMYDRRAWVELETDARGELRIRAAEPIASGDHGDTGLCGLLPGQRVDAEGRLPELMHPQVRVFRFDLG